jgi:hypothetical protein
MQGYFEYGLAYLDVNMPFVHVPTLHILPISSPLLLAVCCIGAILSPTSDAKQTARIFEQRILLQLQSVSIYFTCKFYLLYFNIVLGHFD